MRFDTLTKTFLSKVFKEGCRVLHISSERYSADKLVVEDEYGAMQLVTKQEITTMLQENMTTPIDIVVLALPDSRDLAEAFIAAKIPHVVAFDFKDFDFAIYDANEGQMTVEHVFQCIYTFCTKFYI